MIQEPRVIARQDELPVEVCAWVCVHLEIGFRCVGQRRDRLVGKHLVKRGVVAPDDSASGDRLGGEDAGPVDRAWPNSRTDQEHLASNLARRVGGKMQRRRADTDAPGAIST